MKFDDDQPAGLRVIQVWKCERTDRRTHGQTHRRKLESHPISSLRAYGLGELINGYLVLYKYFLSIQERVKINYSNWVSGVRAIELSLYSYNK